MRSTRHANDNVEIGVRSMEEDADGEEDDEEKEEGGSDFFCALLIRS